MTRGNRFKHEETFKLDIGKTNKFPREAVDVPSIKMFKARLDGLKQPNLVGGIATYARG